ncbi:MAG: malto-oligosyltrehalose trehalohydrolase [Pseudomonadota bacterium]
MANPPKPGSARFAPTWGPTLVDGGAKFKLFAPDVAALSLRTPSGDIPMDLKGDGWFETITDQVPVGAGYGFVLPDGLCVPDPAARAQIGDVHGLSKLVDPTDYRWKTSWSGRPWEEAVIYELHIGTFTGAGTFHAAIDRLGDLADLGVSAVEVLPIAQFGGRRGWGYDGVLLYAPHESYGTPDDFKAFVDAAHGHGLMVLLDVVYNHFGPDGNYLAHYAKSFFDPERDTPWGAALSFEDPAVRSYFSDNPLYWVEEFRLDGLRFDAIDHIKDGSEEHVLEEMARRIREHVDRPVHLCTEDERNIVALHPYVNGAPQRFTAEWNDDFHNVIHPIATGDNEGYYKDFVTDPWAKLGRALTEGFIFQGEPSKMHANEPRGVPSAGQPLTQFVIFNQNHDQVGNRAFGERLISLTDHDMLVALTAMLLLTPQTPLLWMGEEWGETNPFCFFCDFDGELAAAVRKGRRNEFSKFDAFIDPESREDIPDPNAAATFEASKIDWSRRNTPEGAAWLTLYRTLLAARREQIAPRLRGIGPNAGTLVQAEDGHIVAKWRLGDGATMTMAVNLTNASKGDRPQGQVVAAVSGGALQSSSALGPYGVVVTLDEA